jgi:hypothetical protein
MYSSTCACPIDCVQKYTLDICTVPPPANSDHTDSLLTLSGLFRNFSKLFKAMPVVSLFAKTARRGWSI